MALNYTLQINLTASQFSLRKVGGGGGELSGFHLERGETQGIIEKIGTRKNSKALEGGMFN